MVSRASHSHDCFLSVLPTQGTPSTAFPELQTQRLLPHLGARAATLPAQHAIYIYMYIYIYIYRVNPSLRTGLVTCRVLFARAPVLRLYFFVSVNTGSPKPSCPRARAGGATPSLSSAHPSSFPWCLVRSCLKFRILSR